MAETLRRALERTGAALARLRPRKVPVLLQVDYSTCGASCLAMILGYHGRPTPVEEISEVVGSGRDGATAGDLARAGRSYGLMARGYSVEPADLGRLPLPLVAHWKFRHFVVVERCGRRGLDIVDPALGRRRLTPEEVDTAFTGVVVAFEPGPRWTRRKGTRRHPWRRYLGSLLGLRGIRGVLAQVAVASLLLQLFGLAMPLVTKVVVDRVIPAGETAVLWLLGLGIAAWVGAQAVTSLLRAALLIHLQGRLDSRTMVGFLDHLLHLPYGFFQHRTVGDLAMRLASNSLIREVLTSQTVSLLLDAGFALVYLAILLVVSPPFGAVVLAIAVVQAALVAGTTRPMHELMQRDLAADADQQSYLVEAIKGVATVKAAGAEERILDRWSGLFTAYLNVALRRSRFAALVDNATLALRSLAPLALLWFGALQVLSGSASLGTMLALIALAGSFLAPLSSLVATARQLQTAGARLERITEVLDARPEQDPERVRPAPVLRGALEVEGVSFRYRKGAPWALRDVSFRIGPGEKVALVGRSGSGKSTLAALLLGLYRPAAGRVLYDGHPLEELDYRSFRRQVGTVLQESYLFGGSIRSNIGFNDPALPFERLAEAARLAAIDRDVEAMPMGYETLLSEGGGALSGGQRQRLSIARAVASAPKVLVFDEATSHLDSTTEAEVEANLAELAATRIVIAHRLSTVRDADLILVLEGGVVVERGTHAELMVRNGAYAAMVRSQEAGGAETRNRGPTFGLTAADRA